jgi:SAM-dependent methyltransferase
MARSDYLWHADRVQKVELWKPSKFEYRNGRWSTSLDVRQVAHSSRVVTDLAAPVYHEMLREHASGDLLDLGCGDVPCFAMYKPHVRSVVCVDWEATPHPSPHLDLVADLSQPLSLPADSFDTILCSDVLEHLKDPDVLWREAKRLLRPSGKFLISVPFMYWLHEQPHDYHRYTEFRLRSFCAEHGFELEELRATGGGGAVLLDVISKVVVAPRRRPLRAAASRMLLAAAHALHRPTSDTSVVMPLAYVVVARKI